MSTNAPDASKLARIGEAYADLTQVVQTCRRCPRMEGRTRVLGAANGQLSSRILFVAEAPGRFGADSTGTPLSGDRTGRTFEQLLGSAGIRRFDVFVSNAVLCNPRDEAGRNTRPSAAEVANCHDHLLRLIRILDPDWVVTLGAVALEAVARVEPHRLELRRDVGTPVRWFERWLLALYHPGPRALIHRSLDVQRSDYVKLASLLSAYRHAVAVGDSTSMSGSIVESVI